MPGIFISYRRESTAAFAGRLFDRLSTQFGKERTFMDVDGIEPGEDFEEVLEVRLTDAVAMLVLIGPDWIHSRDANARSRLENPGDFVRLEVATALRRKVRVIPILMDGAAMPTAQELPEDLALLSRRQALEVSHARFHQDTEQLIAVLEKQLASHQGAADAGHAEQEARRQAVHENQADEVRPHASVASLPPETRRKTPGREQKIRVAKTIAYASVGVFSLLATIGFATESNATATGTATLVTFFLFWLARRAWLAR